MAMKQFVNVVKDLFHTSSDDPSSPDGMPIPPSELITLVAGTDDIDWFWNSGALGASSMLEILYSNGLSMEKFGTVLDFGCGIGRVIRHFRSVYGPRYYGTDYNPKLITWCRHNLRFARFSTNHLVGKLEYKNGIFDFIYALSVFTHLRKEQQDFWMKELARILKPGGYLFLTTHGSQHYYANMSPSDLERFKNGELIIYGGEVAGTNTCTAFHPESYVRNVLAKDYLVVDFISEGAKGNPLQDVYLLRKPQ
jgi:SAM-dependent methyltransferase